jgi:hypothetical protein
MDNPHAVAINLLSGNVARGANTLRRRLAALYALRHADAVIGIAGDLQAG